MQNIKVSNQDNIEWNWSIGWRYVVVGHKAKYGAGLKYIEIVGGVDN